MSGNNLQKGLLENSPPIQRTIWKYLLQKKSYSHINTLFHVLELAKVVQEWIYWKQLVNFIIYEVLCNGKWYASPNTKNSM